MCEECEGRGNSLQKILFYYCYCFLYQIPLKCVKNATKEVVEFVAKTTVGLAQCREVQWGICCQKLAHSKLQQSQATTNKLASSKLPLSETMTESASHLLTGVKCRATSVAKNSIVFESPSKYKSLQSSIQSPVITTPLFSYFAFCGGVDCSYWCWI